MGTYSYIVAYDYLCSTNDSSGGGGELVMGVNEGLLTMEQRIIVIMRGPLECTGRDCTD